MKLKVFIILNLLIISFPAHAVPRCELVVPKSFNDVVLQKLDEAYSFFRFMKYKSVHSSFYAQKQFNNSNIELNQLRNIFLNELNIKNPHFPTISSISTFLRSIPKLEWQDHLQNAGVDINEIKLLEKERLSEFKTQEIYGLFRYMESIDTDIEHFAKERFNRNHPDVVHYLNEYNLTIANPSFNLPNTIAVHLRTKTTIEWEEHLLRSKVNIRVKTDVQKKELALQQSYSFFKFLKSKNSHYTLYDESNFLNNKTELNQMYSQFLDASKISAPVHKSVKEIYEFLILEDSLRWKGHLLKGNVDVSFIKEKQDNAYLEHITQELHGFIRYLKLKKVDIELYQVKQFDINHPTLVYYLNLYNSTLRNPSFKLPSHMSKQITSKSNVYWPNHLFKAGVNLNRNSIIKDYSNIKFIHKTLEFYDFIIYMGKLNVEKKLYEQENFLNNHPILVGHLAKFYTSNRAPSFSSPEEMALHLINDTRPNWTEHLVISQLKFSTSLNPVSKGLKIRKAEHCYLFFKFMKEMNVHYSLYYESKFKKHNKELRKLYILFLKKNNIKDPLLKSISAVYNLLKTIPKLSWETHLWLGEVDIVKITYEQKLDAFLRRTQEFHGFLVYLDAIGESIEQYSKHSFYKNSPKLLSHLEQYNLTISNPIFSNTREMTNHINLDKTLSWSDHIKLILFNSREVKDIKGDEITLEKIKFSYSFIKFMKNKNSHSSLYRKTKFKNVNIELKILFNLFLKELNSNNPPLTSVSSIYKLLNSTPEIDWDQHLLRGGVNIKALRQKETLAILEIKTQEIYGFLRFMDSLEADPTLFTRERFLENHPDLVNFLTQYNANLKKPFFKTPNSIAIFIIRKTDPHWPEHIRLSKVDLEFKRKIKAAHLKQKKTKQSYEFFRFLESKRARLSFFNKHNFRINQKELVIFFNEFNKTLVEPLFDHPSSVFYHLEYQLNELSWSEHIEDSGTILDDIIALENKILAKNKALIYKEKTEQGYALFKFMKQEKVEAQLYQINRFRKNDKQLVKVFNAFNATLETPRFTTPLSVATHFKENLNEINWVQHLLQVDIDLVQLLSEERKRAIKEKTKLIIDTFKAMKKNNTPAELYSWNRFKNNDPELILVLNKLGIKLKPLAILKHLSRHTNLLFHENLELAGVNYTEEITKATAKKISKIIQLAKRFVEDLVLVDKLGLKKLASSNFRSDRGGFLKDKIKLSPLKDHFATADSFYMFIFHNYRGGWDKFLSDSGIDPNLVRLSGFAEHWKLSRKHKIAASEVENRKKSIMKGGSAKHYDINDKVDSILIDDSNPEQELLTEEENQQKDIDNLTKDFEIEEQKMLNIVLEYFEGNITSIEELASKDFKDFYETQTNKKLQINELNSMIEKLVSSYDQ